MLPSARDVTVDDSWSTIESDLARVDRRDLAQKLEALPASRLTLIATIQPLTALPDADSILRYLARNDPSGYWSTCLLGTAAFIAQQGEAGKAEAARNGTALLLPGLAGQPNALSAAATQFLRVRGLRVEPLVTPGR